MLTFLLVLGLCSAAADESTPLDPGPVHVCKSDILFFFESVSYDHGKWRFELAKNSMGMLWRTINEDKDVTGVCSYKQTLVVPRSSSFEIKNRDISLRFHPGRHSPIDDGRPILFVSMQVGAKNHYTQLSKGRLELEGDKGWEVFPIVNGGLE